MPITEEKLAAGVKQRTIKERTIISQTEFTLKVNSLKNAFVIY